MDTTLLDDTQKVHPRSAGPILIEPHGTRARRSIHVARALLRLAARHFEAGRISAAVCAIAGAARVLDRTAEVRP